MALVIPLHASNCVEDITFPFISLSPYIRKPSNATPNMCEGPPVLSITDVTHGGIP